MPSGAAKLVDMMTLFPQRDILGYGNTHDQGKVLDLGTSIDGYGQLYITAFGMGWLARQTGYISSEEHEEKVAALNASLDEARAEITKLKDALEQVPLVAERMMENVRNAAIAAITDLGGFTDPGESDSGKETESDNGAPVEAAGGDNPAPRKSRRTNVQ